MAPGLLGKEARRESQGLSVGTKSVRADSHSGLKWNPHLNGLGENNIMKSRCVMGFGIGTLALGLMASSVWAEEAQPDVPGPIDSLQDLQDAGKILFKMADTNNDGLISQQEAVGVGNQIVGGYFFRADQDGNGSVSKEERQKARELILAQKPFLRGLVQRAKTNAPEAAANAQAARQGVMSLLDSNSDGELQAQELRQMVQTTVQSLFAAADTDRDGQMSPSEVNGAIAGAARSIVSGVYQKADADNNGQLSQDEFNKAIIEPANAVLSILDANNDGQISAQEFQAAERAVAAQLERLKVPEPANSAKNLIESGKRPAEVAPVPSFETGANRRPQPAPAAPAAPARTVPAVPVQPR